MPGTPVSRACRSAAASSRSSPTSTAPISATSAVAGPGRLSRRWRREIRQDLRRRTGPARRGARRGRGDRRSRHVAAHDPEPARRRLLRARARVAADARGARARLALTRRADSLTCARPAGAAHHAVYRERFRQRLSGAVRSHKVSVNVGPPPPQGCRMNRVAVPRTTRWQLVAVAVLSVLATPAASSAASTVTPEHPTAASPFAGGKWGDQTADAVSKDAYGNNPARGGRRIAVHRQKATVLRGLWSKRDKPNRNLTGQGIGVAVLDSGIDPVPGLRTRQGHLRAGPVRRDQWCVGRRGHLRPRHLHGRHHRRAGRVEPVLATCRGAGRRAARRRSGRQSCSR